MKENGAGIKINKQTIRTALNGAAKSAEAVNLIYVNNDHPGITRKRKGKSFQYFEGNNRITDESKLERIRKLVLPPAWNEVWICRQADGHLQATGIDALKRKQYRYHNLWNLIRNHTKFFRLKEFGNQLPAIRSRVEKDLSLPGYPRDKVLAAAVYLLERTSIRVGNSFYEKLYGSFGITTLKNRHVNINGSKIRFSFKGKKGVAHSISLKSKKLANIIKGCRDIPGKELFEFIDDKDEIQSIDSGMVNEYIKIVSGGDFTAKDFRTWTGSVQALMAFKETGGYETETEMKQKISSAFEMVAKQLGNTIAVCKKYYVHPLIVDLYENKKLDKYLDELKISEPKEIQKGLSAEEKVLMKILEQAS